MRFVQDDKSNDVLKFGLPVTYINEKQAIKQFAVFVAFCPNPTGRTSETSDAHTAKHEETFVAFWPNPDGREREVREAQLMNKFANDVDALPNPAGRDMETSG